MNKRKKHFARLIAEEQRRKPPIKDQKRNTMSTYLKNMAGYKHNQLKTKRFEDIQMLFDKAMTRVNTFVDVDTKLAKGSETRIEGKKAEMKKHMEIVPDDEVAIDAIPLATKPPIIIDWKIIEEGKMGYFQIIRADGSSKRYSSMIQMLQNINREDLETLWKLVKLSMEESTRTQSDSLEAIFFKWSTFCEVSKSAYIYAGREKISSYTCKNHINAQQEALI
ncbi:hypothetical protein Tco_1135536 [Tanacetum coccineum]